MKFPRRSAAALLSLSVVATTAILVSSASAAPSVVRLHLGSNGRFFQYGATTQNLATGANTCGITSAEPVIDLASTATSSSTSSPGLGADGIGVKTSATGSNGTPCSQVDAAETLRLTPGSTMSGRTFMRVRLDLELTGNAVAKLTLSKGSTSALYLLQTGRSITSAQSGEVDYDLTAPYLVSSAPGDTTDACSAPNSSGPNSGSNDNCQWTVTPGFNFDTVTLTTVSGGTVALEGSGDFGNDPNFDTLFTLSNSAPNAVDDTFNTNEDTVLSGNVLANDSDVDADVLTTSLVSGPTHGSLSLASNGGFTYTPALNYYGPDGFSYLATDGVVSDSAQVSLSIAPVNDAPVAVNNAISTPEEQAIAVVVATDVDSTVLTSVCVTTGGTTVDGGHGTVTFTPALNFNGTATVTCLTTDNNGATATSSASITVSVTPVNDAPVGVADVGEVDENASVVLPVVGNDTDADGDVLTPTSIASIAPIGSNVVVNADATVMFTPPLGYTGSASFTYRASDGNATSAATTVNLTVFPVMCSNETVTDTDGDVSGSFTRLSDSFDCKRYTLDASTTTDTVLFQPTGSATVTYQGYITLGVDTAPIAGGPGGFTLLLRYDPTGGNVFHPVQWCVAPTFDANDRVVSASIPPGETWCIASADTRPDGSGDLATTWQVYGRDDPKFTR